jgi:protocatechuate 3,4-dioxygenase beta subunit
MTFLLVAALVGGLAVLARTVLKGDPPAPPGAMTPSAPKIQDPAHLTVEPVAALPPDVQRTEEPRTAPRPDPAAVEGGPPGTISGRVVNPDHEPVANAEIELVRGPSIALQLRQLATETGIVRMTDANGQFKLENVAPAADYAIFASHQDYADAEVGPLVVRAKEETASGDIVLRKSRRVYGYVTCEGAAVEGGVVTLGNQMDSLRALRRNVPNVPDRQESKYVTSTDAKGYYEFASISIENYEVSAESKGLARICKGSQNFLGGAPMEQEIDFELTAALAIHGRVIDDAKNPVAGAKATATIANPNFRCEQSGRSNGDGTFALESLAKGQYFLSVECDGYTMASRAQVEAGGADVEITLQVQGSVTGVVVDETSGAPIPDFELFVLQSYKGRSPARGKIHQHVHDAGGRFELKNLDPGVFQLQGRAVAFADSLSDEFQVARGQATSGVRIAMNRGGSVAGTVADKSGKAVANAVVSLRTNKMKDNPISSLFGNFTDGELEPKAKTDEKGSFRIDLVVPGTYQVAVRHGEFAGLDQNDVEVRKNEVSTVKLEVTSGAKIHGHALGFEGDPLAGATLTATSKAGDYMTTRADDQGAFTFTAMPPGDYTVTVQQFNSGTPMGPFESIVISSNSRVAVSLKDGDDALVDVRLTRNAAPKKPEKKN